MKEKIMTKEEIVVADMLLEAINKAASDATTGGTFTPRSQAISDYERFILAASIRANIKNSD
jgi:hypothetical protein